MRGRTTGHLVAWLAVAAVVQIAALGTVVWVFVFTRLGHQLELVAYSASFVGWRWGAGPLDWVLRRITNGSLGVVTTAVCAVAVLRRRLGLAVVTAGFVAAANVTTQLVKFRMVRPDLGPMPWHGLDFNSLPSGRATATTSILVALVLVLPDRLRGVVALLGVPVAATAGIGTLMLGWHRPSDAVASQLVVGSWAAVAGLVLLAVARRSGRPAAGGDVDARNGDVTTRAPAGHPVAAVTLAIVGTSLLVLAAAALVATEAVAGRPPGGLSRSRLFVAYAGSSAGIAGTASVVVATVLATVHRIVPPQRRRTRGWFGRSSDRAAGRSRTP